MRILHSSDWHIGQSLYGIDRQDDHKHMLLAIKEIVADMKPDLMIVSGDIFHTSQPSAGAQKLLTDSLLEIRNAAPDMIIALTSGNHDSASRHETHESLWRLADIFTPGTIDPDNPDSAIIEIPGKGWLAAIPYVSERNMPEGYYQKVLDRIEERNSEGLPVVMSAHTTVRGSDFRGHDDANDYCVGGIDYVELSEMGRGYDYLALGHIHTPQTHRLSKEAADSKAAARYCGTPLPISFDEQFPHSVSIVELQAHGDAPEISTATIEPLHQLVNIPSSGVGKWEEVLEMLREFKSEHPSYLRLNVEIENSLPAGAFEEASSILLDSPHRLAHINACRTDTKSGHSGQLTVAEFERMTPLDIAARYCEDTGLTLSNELKTLFVEAEKESEEEIRE